MASAHGLALGPFLFRADHRIFVGHAFRVVLTEQTSAASSVVKTLSMIGYLRDQLTSLDLVPLASREGFGGFVHDVSHVAASNPTHRYRPGIGSSDAPEQCSP